MLCQRCRKRDATVSVTLNISGRVSVVHLCDECALLGAFGRQAPENGLWAMQADAGQRIRARRKINELHAQMQAAITNENYEEAARIRDALSKIESEAYTCE